MLTAFPFAITVPFKKFVKSYSSVDGRDSIRLYDLEIEVESIQRILSE